jgi:4-carboxymuconolactone decarboxylase
MSSMWRPQLMAVMVLLLLSQSTHYGQRVSTPRIPPISPAAQAWTPAQREFLGNPPVRNSWRTCFKNEAVCRAWRPFLNSVGRTLPPREREILLLRALAVSRDDYLWTIHRAPDWPQRDLVTDDAARRVAEGPKAPGWNEHEAALVHAADDLIRDAFIKDDTWQVLSKRYNEQQMLDVIFTVGAYTVSSWYVNSAGLQLEEGVKKIPVPR